MDADFQRLRLAELSTVHESESEQKERVSKRERLLQYADSEDDDDFCNTDRDEPLARRMQEKIRQRQGSSLSASSSSSSSSASASTSRYSESDTENSDYGQDYEYEQDENIELIRKFQQRQAQARAAVEQARERNVRLMKYRPQPQVQFERQRQSGDVIEDDDFEDWNDDIDPRTLRRFMQKKTSMPAMGTSLKGSPKKVKKSISTMDIMRKNYSYTPGKNSRHVEYPVYDGDELDEIQDFDLTITLSDYHKLKRKSQSKDLSKYAETTTTRNSQKIMQDPVFYTPQRSRTSQLTKEGKIRLIRSLGKPKVRKVMPAHLYGELVYDPELRKWCGNDEDLLRFESINHLQSKPKLISKSESTPQVVGNMMYDDKKLRWVSLTGSYEDDPFDDDFDTTIGPSITNVKSCSQWGGKNNNTPIAISKKKQQTSSHTRGISGRLVPSESTMSLADHLSSSTNSYRVTAEMYKLWKNEEERWIRKVGNWFPDTEDSHDFKYDLKVFLDRQ